MPPDVVRMRASSTVFVKASSLVNLDFAGIVVVVQPEGWLLAIKSLDRERVGDGGFFQCRRSMTNPSHMPAMG